MYWFTGKRATTRIRWKPQESQALIYGRTTRTSHIPVGEDQKQHIEFAREVANGFNYIYGPVLTMPEALICELESNPTPESEIRTFFFFSFGCC